MTEGTDNTMTIHLYVYLYDASLSVSRLIDFLHKQLLLQLFEISSYYLTAYFYMLPLLIAVYLE